MRTTRSFAYCLTLALLPGIVLANTSLFPAMAATPADDEKSCREFVQKFYDWYLAQSKGEHKESPIEMALKSKKSMFGPLVTAGLNEDLAAARKHPGEIVGLDFDPVLNAQDTADHLAATKVVQKGTAYWVDVYGTWNGKKKTTPDVIPEVALKNGNWEFENFHYPKDGSTPQNDLLSVLKALKKERQK